MNAKSLLLVCVFAALLVLPPLFGFIALMYYMNVHPQVTGMLTALLAVVLAQVSVPFLRKIANRTK